jgi:superfamily II DNA or RNA helicase
LDELQAARALGRHQNLLVAATGTGKTVMAALDYARLRRGRHVETLLFVAHRKEILVQARDTYRHALQERHFGELLVDGEQPTVGRHVFASIASLGKDGRAVGAGLDPAGFDVVVIDEAHHAPAETWTDLLDRINPKELLGLTGTPERSDGLDHERHFPRPWIGNLRVWNAIPHALVPFRYYMIDVPGVDLRDVAWVAGKYAERELAGRLVGAAELFVQRAVHALAEYVGRPEGLRAIAFCADIAHARAVQRCFALQKIRAEVLTGQTASATRSEARGRLDAGEVQVLCVVDIYNEGIDVPNVNTLFFFRPTESATVFLQQLGRGLRRAPGKAELVVFDLTSRQHHDFRFDRKLRGALGHTPKELQEFVSSGFGRLPTGCYVHFDERVQSDVLAQIRRAIPSQFKEIAKLLREPQLAQLSLGEFLHATDVEFGDLYAPKRSWTLLRRQAGLDERPLTDDETQVLENIGKITHVGDPLRLALWERLLAGETVWAPRELRLANMLYVVLYGGKLATTGEAAQRFRQHRMVREELTQLIPVLRRRNATLAADHQLEPTVPLVLHARYLAGELAAAFDVRTKDNELREAYYTGVEAVTDGGRQYDLLLVTLEKSAGTKEHLKYRDFPLSERRFHWQSKAATTVDSKEGRRHRLAPELGVTPLLFVREQEKAGGRTASFRYLGPVRALSCSGERPVTVEWELRFPMPAEVVIVGRVAG